MSGLRNDAIVIEDGKSPLNEVPVKAQRAAYNPRANLPSSATGMTLGSTSGSSCNRVNDPLKISHALRPANRANPNAQSLLNGESRPRTQEKLEAFNGSTNARRASLLLPHSSKGHLLQVTSAPETSRVPIAARPGAVNTEIIDLVDVSDYSDSEDSVIDLTGLQRDEITQAEYQNHLRDEGENVHAFLRDSSIMSHEGLPSQPYTKIERCGFDNNLKVGDALELENGEFIRIRSILRHKQTMEVVLRGWIFWRTKAMPGYFPNRRNELCWISQFDESNEQSAKEQAIKEVPLNELKTGQKRNLIMTNRDFPELSFRDRGLSGSDDVVYSEYDLICRWKFVAVAKNAQDSRKKAWCDQFIQKLQEEDIDENMGVSNRTLKSLWRPEDILAVPLSLRRNGMEPITPTRRPQHNLPSDIIQTLPCQSRRGRNKEYYPNFATSVKAQSSKNLAFVDLTSRSEAGLGPNRRLFPNRSVPNTIDLTASDPFTSFTPSSKASFGYDTTPTTSPLRRRRHPSLDEDIWSATGEDISSWSAPFTLDGLSRAGEKLAQSVPKRLKTSDPFTNVEQPGHHYTFGDAFCGAGGMSRAAKLAGLRVQWGFDFDKHAIRSFGLNFPDANDCLAEASHFVTLKEDNDVVDILHLSPPCQFFSAAHTIQGKDDEMNTASLFAIPEVIKKARPRVVTLEQTSGLMKRHPLFMKTVVHMFTDLGFSVRWKIINCADYGLVQSRNRLFIIASCPGEILPPFPKPTHVPRDCPNPLGLPRYTSVNSFISHIPTGHANHDLAQAHLRQTKPPYNGNEPLRSCITTKGGDGNYHPSGQRNFTLREFACLQGFPLEHQFGPIGIKKQIGNAVPPNVGSVLLKQVVKALSEADGRL